MIENVRRKGLGYIFMLNGVSQTLDTIRPFKDYDDKFSKLEYLRDDLDIHKEEALKNADDKMEIDTKNAIISHADDTVIYDINDKYNKLVRSIEITYKNDLLKINEESMAYIETISTEPYGELYLYLKDNKDVLPEEKTTEENIEYMRDEMTAYIYNSYSMLKQSQDSNNEMNARTRVLALMYSHQVPGPIPVEYEPFISLETYVVNTAKDIIDGTLLYTDAVSAIPTDIQEYVSKLLRIALRSAWVDNCKVELARAITDGDSPSYVPIFTT